jgi:glucosamine kinase
MSVYLAVDAGGTKTECVIADDERVLARVTGETVKIMQVGAPEATARLRQLLEEASSIAKVPLYLITRACMGLAGISSEGVRAWAEECLGEVLTGDLILTGDEEIAMEAAFGQGPGVLVIAGTGSHVVGRCSNGSRMTAGGWGPMLGDEGSGHWIGLEGIRSGFRALDRGLPSCLLREVYGIWGISSIGTLVAKANSRPRPDFAVLAEGVARCAMQGDALAKSVLDRAGEELAAQVNIVISKMHAAACESSDVERVAFTGSVLSRIPAVREAMGQSLRLVHTQARVDDRATEAIEGALARARRG